MGLSDVYRHHHAGQHVRVAISVGTFIAEIEDDTGYSPDVADDMCARTLALAKAMTTPEQVAAAASEADDGDT